MSERKVIGDPTKIPFHSSMFRPQSWYPQGKMMVTATSSSELCCAAATFRGAWTGRDLDAEFEVASPEVFEVFKKHPNRWLDIYAEEREGNRPLIHSVVQPD